MEEKIDLLLIEVKRVRKELKEVADLLELHRAEHSIGGQGGSTSGMGGAAGGHMQQPQQGMGPGMGGGQFPGGNPMGPGMGGMPGMGGTPDFACLLYTSPSPRDRG